MNTDRRILSAVLLITGLALAARSDSVRLTWDSSPSAGVAGYRVYYGTNSRVYSASCDVGLVLTQSVQVAQRGRWFFAVTAYDTNGIESAYSDEVQWELLPEPPTVRARGFVRLTPKIERSTNLLEWETFDGAPSFIEATNAAEFFRTTRLSIEAVRRINP